MAFRFRLDTVLRHRKRTEDAAALDLARARQQLEAIRDRLAALHADTEECRRQLTIAAARGATGMELSRLAFTVERLQIRSSACTTELAAQQKRVDEARDALVKASRAHRILEKLESSARRTHRTRVEKLEQRDIDELASTGFVSRRDRGGLDAEDSQ